MNVKPVADYVRPGQQPLYAALLAIVFSFAISKSAAAAEIWVVVDRDHPVRISTDVRLIELDAPKRIESELSAHLPNDLHRAAEIVQGRLKDGGQSLQRRLAKAYQDVADAWSVGVIKIPAIVVDRRYVIYGEVNVDRAVRQIEKYRSEHK